MALLTEAQSAISIHAPREGGDVHRKRVDLLADISIHAPREGGDRRQSGLSGVGSHFNPRPPRGGRPIVAVRQLDELRISIHAPREGGDAPDAREEAEKAIFQSTPPARGATPRPATSAAAR